MRFRLPTSDLVHGVLNWPYRLALIAEFLGIGQDAASLRHLKISECVHLVGRTMSGRLRVAA